MKLYQCINCSDIRINELTKEKCGNACPRCGLPLVEVNVKESENLVEPMASDLQDTIAEELHFTFKKEEDGNTSCNMSGAASIASMLMGVRTISIYIVESTVKAWISNGASITDLNAAGTIAMAMRLGASSYDSVDQSFENRDKIFNIVNNKYPEYKAAFSKLMLGYILEKKGVE